jgi:hypothetical protein
MRIDGRGQVTNPTVARAKMMGALMAGLLLMAGCGMVTVVSEESRSDYALCIDKREAGGVAPEVAALDRADVAGISKTDTV